MSGDGQEERTKTVPWGRPLASRPGAGVLAEEVKEARELGRKSGEACVREAQ